MSSVQRSVSLYDLMQFSEAKQAILKGDKKTVEKILYSLGLDTNETYELEDCLHRPLTKKDNEPWQGGRYVAGERLDSEWLSSGNASWEAQIEACNDGGLRADLKYMSKQGSSEKAFTDEESGKKASRYELDQQKFDSKQ